MVRFRTCVVSPLTRFLNPSRIPMTSIPWLMASMVTELMTPLMPGAGPPPTTMTSLPRGDDSAMRSHLAVEPGGPEGRRTRGLARCQHRTRGRVFKGTGRGRNVVSSEASEPSPQRPEALDERLRALVLLVAQRAERVGVDA